MTARDQTFVLLPSVPDEWEWERQMRGLYAEPDEARKPAFYEVALNPINRIEVQAR